jgi:hypothetical protein
VVDEIRVLKRVISGFGGFILLAYTSIGDGMNTIRSDKNAFETKVGNKMITRNLVHT